MKIHQNALNFQSDVPVVLTIGTFDGVHAGHRAVLHQVASRAAELGAQTVLLTFDPHPRTVLHPPPHGLRLLNTLGEKAALLERVGVDHLVVHPFTLDLARMTPKDYVKDLFANGIRPVRVIVGYDHRFGRNREGNFESLHNLGTVYGFEVEKLAAHYEAETRVSSTKVREALANGDVRTAAQWLQTAYPLTGQVVRGEGRGRQWGVPTVNLASGNALKLVPAEGAYACWAYIADDPKPYHAMVNIGRRPTVATNGDVSVEAHLLHLDRDLYGQTVQLHFIARLRPEQRFNGPEELLAQLERDRLATQYHCNLAAPPAALFNPCFPA